MAAPTRRTTSPSPTARVSLLKRYPDVVAAMITSPLCQDAEDSRLWKQANQACALSATPTADAPRSWSRPALSPSDCLTICATMLRRTERQATVIFFDFVAIPLVTRYFGFYGPAWPFTG